MVLDLGCLLNKWSFLCTIVCTHGAGPPRVSGSLCLGHACSSLMLSVCSLWHAQECPYHKLSRANCYRPNCQKMESPKFFVFVLFFKETMLDNDNGTFWNIWSLEKIWFFWKLSSFACSTFACRAVELTLCSPLFSIRGIKVIALEKKSWVYAVNWEINTGAR